MFWNFGKREFPGDDGWRPCQPPRSNTSNDPKPGTRWRHGDHHMAAPPVRRGRKRKKGLRTLESVTTRGITPTHEELAADLANVKLTPEPYIADPAIKPSLHTDADDAGAMRAESVPARAVIESQREPTVPTEPTIPTTPSAQAREGAFMTESEDKTNDEPSTVKEPEI